MSLKELTIEEIEEKYGKGFADHYTSIDWDQLHKNGELRDIGTELYENAVFLENVGVMNAVAVVASIMDIWRSSVPRRISNDVANTIATGFAFGLVRQAADAAIEDDEEEGGSL